MESKLEKRYIKVSIKQLFISIIVFFIIVMLGIMIIKAIIFNNIANKMEVYMKSSNYYIRCYFYQGWNASTTEIWVKNKNMVYKSNNELTSVVQDNRQYDILENNIVTSNSQELILDNNWLYIKSLQNDLRNLKNIIKYSLDVAKINGKNCYKILASNTILYIEKTTGLPVRIEIIDGLTSAEEIQSTILDYKFTFDNVKDEDVKIDLSNYNQK